MARLSRKQVLAIRESWELGETIRDIAKQYKRAESTISDVVHHRTYTRVKPGEVKYVPGPNERPQVEKYDAFREHVRAQSSNSRKRR